MKRKTDNSFKYVFSSWNVACCQLFLTYFRKKTAKEESVEVCH